MGERENPEPRTRDPGLCAKPTIQDLLRDVAGRLKAAGVDRSFLDAEVLLSKASGLSRMYLLAHPETELSADTVSKFEGWVCRRETREPLAYITGEKEFFGLCFEVTPAVLVPRPETEVLVETAADLLKEIANPEVADIGVGSGAVAVGIATADPDAVVWGTDTSLVALEIASRNAGRLGVGDRARFIEGDLLSPLVGRLFDLIVSNPPYIRTEEIARLAPEIANYEPRQALDGGPDGLCYHRRLARDAPEYLKAGGVLAVEVGMGQARAVQELFRTGGFQNVRSVQDYSRIERVVLGEKGRD